MSPRVTHSPLQSHRSPGKTGIHLQHRPDQLDELLMLLVRQLSRRDLVLAAFNSILLVSFLVEDTLEMQIGVVVYLFFHYLGWDAPQPSGESLSSPAT